MSPHLIANAQCVTRHQLNKIADGIEKNYERNSKVLSSINNLKTPILQVQETYLRSILLEHLQEARTPQIQFTNPFPCTEMKPTPSSILTILTLMSKDSISRDIKRLIISEIYMCRYVLVPCQCQYVLDIRHVFDANFIIKN